MFKQIDNTTMINFIDATLINNMTSLMVMYILGSTFIVGLIVYFMYHRWNKKRRGEDHNAKANTEASEILNHKQN